ILFIRDRTMAQGYDWDVLFREADKLGNTQAIFTRLADLENSKLQRKIISRWIWELIQNARGTVGSQPDLEVQIELSNEQLFFRHNGAPFRKEEIVTLIKHGSTKLDPRDIGRYGTGFITTHLISKRVQIHGELIEGGSFDFILNREGANVHDLATAITDSQEAFLASLDRNVPRVPPPYTTEYGYPLSPEVMDIVNEGVTALKRFAPYIFAFNPMLH